MVPDSGLICRCCECLYTYTVHYDLSFSFYLRIDCLMKKSRRILKLLFHLSVNLVCIMFIFTFISTLYIYIVFCHSYKMASQALSIKELIIKSSLILEFLGIMFFYYYTTEDNVCIIRKKV